MKKLLTFYSILKNHKYTTLAGAIAFFFIVNGGSLVFLIALTLNLFHFEFKEYILESNDAIKAILLYFEQNADGYYKPFYFVLIFTSIWSSSTLFYHLIAAGEMIYQKKRPKFLFISRVLSILFVFIFIGVVLTSFIISLIGNYMMSQLENSFFEILIKLFLYLIIPLIVILFFMLFVPPMRVKLKNIYKGASFTVLFWTLATIIFQIYLNLFVNYKAIYGALTFVIVTMIYIYLLAIGLIVGLIINMLEITKIESHNNEII